MFDSHPRVVIVPRRNMRQVLAFQLLRMQLMLNKVLMTSLYTIATFDTLLFLRVGVDNSKYNDNDCRFNLRMTIFII